jgi:hypothetical protein
LHQSTRCLIPEDSSQPLSLSLSLYT